MPNTALEPSTLRCGHQQRDGPCGRPPLRRATTDGVAHGLTSGGPLAAAADEESGRADGQQPKNRRFRHGLKGESDCGCIQAGGKGALHSARRVFIDAIAAGIRLKQVARAVKGQSQGVIQTGDKSALHSTRREFINAAASQAGHIEISRAVKSQSIRIRQSRGKRALHSAWRVFIYGVAR